MPTSRVPLIFGASPFGLSSTNDMKRLDAKASQELLDTLAKHGYKEIDTSRLYGRGASEETLGKIDVHGARIDTKTLSEPGDHAPKNLRASVLRSIEALGAHNKIRTLYLHIPDRTIPYEDILEEVNKLYKEGCFESFGLSNYWAWEVAQICTIAKERGLLMPTVYQGAYNILGRTGEIELFPVIRKFGLRFVAYSPLAGGLLKGNPTRPGGRYDPSTTFGPFQTKLYAQAKHNEAVEMLKVAAVRILTFDNSQYFTPDNKAKHDMSVGELALRWIQHHSGLTSEDGIVFGATSVTQMEENIKDFEKGPLPQDLVEVVEDAWAMVRGDTTPYGAPFGPV